MFEEWYLNEVFSSKIRNAWKLTDHYLLRSIFNILDESSVIHLLQSPVSINEILKSKKYPVSVFSSVQWILERLALDGYVKKNIKENEVLYNITNKKMEYDLEQIKDKAFKMAPDSISAFNMLKLMADNYLDYLSGKKSGIDIIFSSENIDITNEYYRNNLFYNVHNIVGAKILNWQINKRDNPNILEVGGGLGGGTKEFLKQRLKNNDNLNFSYYFTDIANKMLRDTKKAILKLTDNIDNFNFSKLNFNKDLEEQGYIENSFDIVWGVNALHVANDLRFTLNEFYKILKPNGTLIVCETVRPVGNRMIQQEILLNTIDDYWNVKVDKDIRPRHGFMEWSDWVNALKVIGFSDVKTIPDMLYLEEQYNNCYVAVIVGIKK
jgi:ubiquinone/menaquinone biosynthesis C-methylase UbiE